MRTTACVKSLAAAAIVGAILAAPLAVPANASIMSLDPSPSVNNLALGDDYFYNVVLAKGADPDVNFVVKSTDKLSTLYFQSIIPYGLGQDTVPNLTAQWFQTDLTTPLSGLLHITDANGAWNGENTISLAFNVGEMAVLVITGDPALRSTQFGVEI